MQVLVFETLHTGHRLAYLSHLLPAIQALGARPILATTETAVRSREFQCHLNQCQDCFEVQLTPGYRKPTEWRPVETTSQLLWAIEKCHPDHLIMPGGDVVSQLLSMQRMLGRPLWDPNLFSETLLFRGGYGCKLTKLKDRIRRSVYRRILSWAPWSVTYHLDPVQCDGFNRRVTNGRPWQLMPDPVESPPQLTRTEARRQLKLPEGRLFVLPGGINQRKGVAELLLAWEELSKRSPEDHRLLLAGSQDDSARRLLADRYDPAWVGQRIVQMDWVLSAEEFAACFVAADVVVAAYPKHVGSASMVIRSAAAERPVVGADTFWSGRTIPMFDLGRTCDPRNVQQFAATLESSMADSLQFQQSQKGKRFVQYHSPENFAATWTQNIRHRMGLPPSPDQKTWDWVFDPTASNEMPGAPDVVGRGDSDGLKFSQ